MSISRVEILRNELVQIFEGISIENGYRTDVKRVYPIPMLADTLSSYPSISVILDTEKFGRLDDPSSVKDSLVDVIVLGYVKGNTVPKGDDSLQADFAEPLLHDIKRKVLAFSISAINGTENKWNVSGEGKFERFIIPGQNIGWVTASFTVRVRAQDSNL